MKATVVEYNKRCVVVKTNSEIEKQLIDLFGMFVEKPKNSQSPCWVFSQKRKAQVEKLAKKLGGNVTEYNPGRSIALMGVLPHEKDMLEAGGHFNSQLKEGEKRFAGWIFRAKDTDKVVELCKSLNN